MKKLLRFIVYLLILLMVFKAASLIFYWKTPDDVSSIYVRHSSFNGLVHYKEKLVDVDNCLYFEYEMPNEWVEREPEAENNGYQMMRKLDSNEMKSFFRSASLWGFWSWNGEYDNRTVQDGDTWEVIITYKNGKTHQVNGYCNRPMTWKQVSKAYLRLTGEGM